MVAVDDYNWFFRPSNQPAFMYDNVKSLNGRVPPYHIALCRLFMRFDGHKIKRGYKIAGVSTFKIPKHYFEPKKINFPLTHCTRIEKINLEFLPNLVRYASENNLDFCGSEEPSFIRQLWMEHQGNYGYIMFSMNNPEHRSI